MTDFDTVDGEIVPVDTAPRALTPWAPAPIRIRLPEVEDAPLTMTWERRAPHHQTTVEGDVVVPAAQAAITAVFLAITAGAVCLVAGWSVRVMLIAFGVALGLAWFWRLRLADRLLWTVETISGRDVDHDGQVGKPAQSFALVNPATARAEAKQAEQSTESEARKAELLAFVDRCYRLGTGERAHGVRASGSDRESYVRQRDVLLSLGIARWKHEGRPRAGWVMAVSHQKAMQIIAQHVL